VLLAFVPPETRSKIVPLATPRAFATLRTKFAENVSRISIVTPTALCLVATTEISEDHTLVANVSRTLTVSRILYVRQLVQVLEFVPLPEIVIVPITPSTKSVLLMQEPDFAVNARPTPIVPPELLSVSLPLLELDFATNV